jgi:hypothetical protein
MDELIKDLESCVDKINNLSEITSKSKNFIYGFLEVYKKMEDGLLDNIHKADDKQLNYMLNHRFKYYIQFNDGEILAKEITKRLREHKINEILE